MSATRPAWIVMKFGGTSVATLERWKTIAAVARQCLEAGQRPFIVCSAVSRVSRMLEKLLVEALHGNREGVLAEIKARHHTLAAELGLDADTLLHPYFEELERLSMGVTLTREVSPHLKARVLATGELMLTTLGAAYLNAQGLTTAWRDARTLLRAIEQPRMVPHQRYLFAVCDHTPDPDFQQACEAETAQVILTQGFIGGNEAGETVLLGWGGSDTSASYFAAKLQAQRLEIWTDVPGMFTANPRKIPSARLLKMLDYDEARELASSGAEVLHPRCLDPVGLLNIPLYIRCTQAPEMEGTVIAGDVPALGAQVKAISARYGLTLITMETPRMWQQVGFLAQAFAVFEQYGLSIDLVATSETNVTVSIDPMLHVSENPAAIESLLTTLNGFCEARQIGPCAAVSLVGRNIRSILHELGPALEALDEQNIYLVSQAASDLNITFVVEEKHADRLVSKLHAQLFDLRSSDDLLGSSWTELFEAHVAPSEVRVAWWHDRRDDLLALAQTHAPCYVYDEATLRGAAQSLHALGVLDRVFYAMKANANTEVLRLFHDLGLGFECVSPGEIAYIQTLFPDLDPQRILFTPNFAPHADYEAGFASGGFMTLDNLYPLEAWPELFEGKEVIVRIDPGRGHGHHKHVRTAGAQSKFGVTPTELDRLEDLARAAGVRVIGLHAHVGSGITVPETWSETAFFLASLADRFPDVRILNLGGGLGVADRLDAQPFDVGTVAETLVPFRQVYPQFALWMEPGRYLVAEAGVLLARATQRKQKGHIQYVGLETGMNSLIRPALYGAYHEIVNLTRLDAPRTMTAEVVGPICETGDILGHGRRLPETTEGDVFLIATAGAYGRVMSSHYNLREPATEVMLRRG